LTILIHPLSRKKDRGVDLVPPRIPAKTEAAGEKLQVKAGTLSLDQLVEELRLYAVREPVQMEGRGNRRSQEPLLPPRTPKTMCSVAERYQYPALIDTSARSCLTFTQVRIVFGVKPQARATSWDSTIKAFVVQR